MSMKLLQLLLLLHWTFILTAFEEHQGDDITEEGEFRKRCSKKQFTCSNGQCIRKKLKCNGKKDCQDGSDESTEVCGGGGRCTMKQFTCSNGQCIRKNLKCNGKKDCKDGSDESTKVCGGGGNSHRPPCKSQKDCRSVETCLKLDDETCTSDQCPGSSYCVVTQGNNWEITCLITSCAPDTPICINTVPKKCDKPPCKITPKCISLTDGEFPKVAQVPSEGDFEEQKETEEFLQAVKKGEEAVEDRLEAEKELFDEGIVPKEGTATVVHQSFLNASAEDKEISNKALAIEVASEALLEQCINKGLKRQPCSISHISKLQFKDTAFGKSTCWPTALHRSDECTDPYRTFTGWCNNLAQPITGRAQTPFIRLLPPAYEDDIKKPRTTSSFTLKSLPCARKISQMLTECNVNNDIQHTMMVMQWGQFLDHDLSLSPTETGYLGAGIECCHKKLDLNFELKPILKIPPPISIILIKPHSQCFPICIPSDDPYYGCYNITCMNFVRTMAAPTASCTLGPRQQMNKISHYLDGSMVYGSSKPHNDNLRELAGRLKTQNDLDGYKILPQKDVSHCKVSDGDCFEAGDERVNEQPNLALTHDLWVREHNRIADHYTSKGKGNDEAFQLARRLVIAELQHITYKEFLPIVLGSAYMTARNMKPEPTGSYYTGYNPSTDATISNAFATAAYRFGHSLLGDFMQLNHHHGSLWKIDLPLSSMFSLQKPIHYQMNRMLHAFGLIMQNPEKVDMCFTKEVTERLFQETGKPGSGLDLVALNIQRGRDHGLKSYLHYRFFFCNLDPEVVLTFSDMTWLPTDVRSRLASVYAHPWDIDLFVGGMVETPVPGALVGPTFQCIIGDQFYRLREGDRFYYESNAAPNPMPFSIAQLDAIKTRVSLARIFCDNADGVNDVTPNVFLDPSPSNLFTACASLPPGLDLDIF